MVENQAEVVDERRGCSCLPFFRGWGRPFRNLFGRSNSENGANQQNNNRVRASSQATRVRGIQAAHAQNGVPITSGLGQNPSQHDMNR